MRELKWVERDGGMWGSILDNGENIVFISYQPNTGLMPTPGIDSSNPETAIVLIGDKENGRNRYLICRGDWRDALEKLYPDVDALKAHWKEHGGHFWTDSLEDN